MFIDSRHTANQKESRQNSFFSPFSFYHPLPKTKDLPCGILANALSGRRDVFNINLIFTCYEKKVNSAPEMHYMHHEHRS
jgi:hypothetical protein